MNLGRWQHLFQKIWARFRESASSQTYLSFVKMYQSFQHFRAVAIKARLVKDLLEEYGDSIWLLPSKSGNGPIYTNRFNTNLKKVCEMAGVKYFSSHGIRFHNISAMYDAGISEKEIQRLSGHTTANMTRHYNKTISHYSEDDKIREVYG